MTEMDTLIIPVIQVALAKMTEVHYYLQEVYFPPCPMCALLSLMNGNLVGWGSEFEKVALYE